MTTARVAFDRLASSYDSLAAGDAFRLQRQQTHIALARWIRPGVRVLEIGCGTGCDTEFLAKLGARVIACDPSEGMLSQTARRIARADVGHRVSTLACGLEDLPHFLNALDHGEGFDAVVSNFGALNCAPSLQPLGDIGRQHLRPGGVMAIGLLGRTCLSEMVYFAAKADRQRAVRRWQPTVSVPVAGVDVATHYHRSRDIATALGACFHLDATLAIGLLVPPPYLEPRWQMVPPSLRDAAAAIDRVAGGWPLLNRFGDHTLTRWVKRRVPCD